MSSLHPLETRVAKAELFLRQCRRCQRAFWFCRSREPGRLYCVECSPLARRERERRARKEYRASDEGREQHRDEEFDRRRRRRLERDRVGDRRCDTDGGQIEVRSTKMARESAVEEMGDAHRNVEWVLVAWTELLAVAQDLLGAQLVCPCCGRWGRVTEVLEHGEWRTRRREETS